MIVIHPIYSFGLVPFFLLHSMVAAFVWMLPLWIVATIGIQRILQFYLYMMGFQILLSTLHAAWKYVRSFWEPTATRSSPPSSETDKRLNHGTFPPCRFLWEHPKKKSTSIGTNQCGKISSGLFSSASPPSVQGRQRCNRSTESSKEGMTNKYIRLHANRHVKETKESYEITIDVPGVKVEDIQVELLNQRILHVSAERTSSTRGLQTLHPTAVLKYEEHFELDTRKMQPQTTSATYEDGVLTIVVQKKVPVDPIAVTVLSEYPPVSSDNAVVAVIGSVALPGVKSNAVRVTFLKNEDVVVIEATRTESTTGNRMLVTKTVLPVDGLPVEKMQAYLMDGMLIITTTSQHKQEGNTANTHDGDENGKDRASYRIPIATPASIGSLATSDTTNDRKSLSPTSTAPTLTEASLVTTSNEMPNSDSMTTTTTELGTTAVPPAVTIQESKAGIFDDAVAVETVRS